MLLRPPATCDFGKSLLSDQRMNGPIGIMCLRPVVGSLAATVAAILLYGSNHTDAQEPQGVGIMYLTPNDQAGDPIHDLSGAPEWTNPAVQGFPCAPNGLESSHTNTLMQMTSTGVISIKAWPWGPLTEKTFPFL
jgi:hypothetical protein